MQYVGLSALEMEISTHHDGDVVATARSNGPTPAENEVVNCDSISVYRKEYDYPSQFDAPAEISDSVEIGELELTASLDEVISFKEPEEYLALQDSSQMLNSDVAVAGSDADAVVELVNDAWSSAVFDSFIDESRGLETFDTRFSAGASTSGSENGLALEDLKAIPMGDDIPEDEESIDGNPNFFNNSLDVLNKRDQALSFELSEVITMKNREPSQHITEEVGLTDQLEHTLESHDVNEGTYSISASDLAASRRHVPINELWTLDLDEVILSSVNEETEPISFAPLDRLVELWTVDLDGLYMNESPATNANGNFGSATITSEEFPRRGNLEHDEDLERLALQINSIVHDVTHRTRICMEAINKL
ncbi:hypothetical protein MPSEU_001006200 [Mayamaea pseudoterrestris]|nr:hypothetical protein MPSEU_001006200 [Mayamaea pseudoterrestris]